MHGSPADRLDRSAPTPLWRQLARDLGGRLDRGEFTDTFPGEIELGRAVRGQPAHRARGPPAATGGRRDQHRPRAASPSWIAATEPVIDQPTGIVYSLFSAVESRGLSQVSVVRALDVRADGVIAPRLGLEESTPLVYLDGLRLLLDGEPLALDRVWLPASIGEPLLGVDFRRTGVYDELSRTGITAHRRPRDRPRRRPEQGRAPGPRPAGAVGGLLGRTDGEQPRRPDRMATDAHPRRPVRPDQHARGRRHRRPDAGHHPLLGPDPESRPIPPGGTTMNPTTRLTDLDPRSAVALLDRGQAVHGSPREPAEWAAGHAPQAEHRPLGGLDPAALDPELPVVAICRSGNRSGKAADLLAAAGVRVHNVAGGMKAWAEAGLPVLVTDAGEQGTVA